MKVSLLCNANISFKYRNFMQLSHIKNWNGLQLCDPFGLMTTPKPSLFAKIALWNLRISHGRLLWLYVYIMVILFFLATFLTTNHAELISSWSRKVSSVKKYTILAINYDFCSPNRNHNGLPQVCSLSQVEKNVSTWCWFYLGS